MRDIVFAIPGDLAAPTGGYKYARRLLERLPSQGIQAIPLMLPGSFPEPASPDLEATAAAFAALPPRVPLLADGLAYGALPPRVIAAAGPRPIVALVHHPLGLETGLASARAEALIASETAALACATRVLVTSLHTAEVLAQRFGVPLGRIDVAPPGTDAAERVLPRSRRDPALLTVGAVTPRKAHDLLIGALAQLADLPWHLTIAGALDQAPAHATQLAGLIEEAGLTERVTVAGAVASASLDRLYREADIVVSASLYEGYGMALTEALARGLPIVMASAGAAAETIPDAAALKVPPGDAAGLAAALRLLIAKPELRAQIAEAAWQAGRNLPRWTDTAQAVAAALRAACNAQTR